MGGQITTLSDDIDKPNKGLCGYRNNLSDSVFTPVPGLDKRAGCGCGRGCSAGRGCRNGVSQNVTVNVGNNTQSSAATPLQNPNYGRRFENDIRNKLEAEYQMRERSRELDAREDRIRTMKPKEIVVNQPIFQPVDRIKTKTVFQPVLYAIDRIKNLWKTQPVIMPVDRVKFLPSDRSSFEGNYARFQQ